MWSRLLRTSGARAGNGILESDSGRRAESKAGLDTEGCVYLAGLSGVKAESASERPGQAQTSPHTEERGVRSGKGKVLFPSQCWLNS